MVLISRSTPAPASGEDTLEVRETYLRRRSARTNGIWRSTMLWVALGAVGCWLCVAVVGGLFLG
jgi:hypothetical protein